MFKTDLEVMNISFYNLKKCPETIKQDEFKDFQVLLYKFKHFEGLAFLF